MQQFLENGEGVTNPLEHMVEDKINTLLTGDPNKVKVYADGYDGHCFRTYYYWKDQIPDIRYIEEDTVECFEVAVGSKTIQFTATDTINYQGKHYTGKQFYELCSN